MIIDLQVDDEAYLFAMAQPGFAENLDEIQKVRNEVGKVYFFPLTSELNVQPVFYNGVNYAFVYLGHSSLTLSIIDKIEQYYFALTKDGFAYISYMEKLPEDDGGYFTEYSSFVQYVSGYYDD